MIKRIVLVILTLVTMSCPVYSSFLNESSAYFKIADDITSAWYINDEAIEIIRYDPPYYAIKGNIIHEEIGTSKIESMTGIFYYDYSKQIIKFKPLTYSTYTTNGTLLKTENYPSNTIYDSTYHSDALNIYGLSGDFYFFKCYNIFFFKEENIKYGLKL